MAGFEAPKSNPYGRVRPKRDQAPAAPQADQAPKDQEQPKWYHFNMKLPEECRAYLQEMAWRNRTTITQYLQDMVMADMAAHPDWRDGLDELNK